MGDFYWELIQFDGTTTEVPPDLVDTIKKRMAQGQPINTKSMVIPVNQVKSFRKTSKPYKSNRLLAEGAAQAFNDPMLNKDGSIQAKWVKKEVTKRDYDRKFSTYRVLEENSGMVTVAYRLAVHDIDTTVVTECTIEDIKHLTQGK